MKQSNVSQLRLSIVLLVLWGTIASTPANAEESETRRSLLWAPVSLSLSQVNATNPSKPSLEKCSTVSFVESNGTTSIDCGSNRFTSLVNLLTPCDVDSRISCIKSLEIQLPDEPWNGASYNGPAGIPDQTWAVTPSIDLGQASNGSLFDTTDNSGQKHTWHVSASYRMVASEFIPGFSGPKTYEIDIKPVQKIPRSECLSLWKTNEGRINTLSAGNTSDCFMRLTNPPSFKARLVLQLRRKPRGWVTGFLKGFRAEVGTDTETAGQQLVTIEGESSIIPLVGLQISSSEKERRERFCTSQLIDFKSICQSSFPWQGNAIFLTYSDGSKSAKPTYLELLKSFPELDKASAEWSSWSMQLNMQQDSVLKSCSTSNGIYGFVGSNALMTDDQIPVWNQQTQSLDFNLTSPHYRASGVVAKGFYELQLDEQVAKCLWGTKVTPLNIGLSVFDEDGESKVAVISIATRNGMVVFKAAGFSYSSTRLSISLKKFRCHRNGQIKIPPRGKQTCPKGWTKKA